MISWFSLVHNGVFEFIYLIRYTLGGIGFFLGGFIYCTYDIVQLHIYLFRHFFLFFLIFYFIFLCSWVWGLFEFGRVDAYYNG